MSKTNEELATLENAYADFSDCIERKDWKGAHAIVDNLGDLGYENEAMTLHRLVNRKQASLHREYVPSQQAQDYDQYGPNPLESHV